MHQPESDTAALFDNDLLLLRAIFRDRSGTVYGDGKGTGGQGMRPEERIAWMRRWLPKTYAYLAASRLLDDAVM